MKSLILVSQRKVVFEAIEKTGLDPRDFKWCETNRDPMQTPHIVSKLVHTPSGYYFVFDVKNRAHLCEFFPGEEVQVQELFSGEWETQVIHFRRWLGYVERETETLDPWAAILREKELLLAAWDPDERNTPFSAEEIKRISAGLEEIKQLLLKDRGFSDEMLQRVDAKFNHVKQALTRMGRKDWVFMLIGCLVTILSGGAFAPSAAREVFRFVAEVFSWLIHTQLSLP
jgi:hypothetical protein